MMEICYIWYYECMSKVETFIIHYRYLEALMKKRGFSKRGEEGKTHADFARMVGVSPGYLSQLLSGDRRPSARVLKRIAFHLNISVANLLASDHELAEYGISHVIAAWVVDQEDLETTEKIDVKTMLEILRYRSRFEVFADDDEAVVGDGSVFLPPED